MSFLDQAKAAATSAMNTATNLTNQATAAAQPALQNLSASVQPALQNMAASVQPTLQNISASVQPTLNSVAQGATAAANQAQAGLHSVVPSVVPAPSSTSTTSGGIDTSHDLHPHNASETAPLNSFLNNRPSPTDLQQKNILKGSPNDALAGKKADLARAQVGDKLDGYLQSRPAPGELVRDGILTPGEAPPTK